MKQELDFVSYNKKYNCITKCKTLPATFLYIFYLTRKKLLKKELDFVSYNTKNNCKNFAGYIFYEKPLHNIKSLF